MAIIIKNENRNQDRTDSRFVGISTECLSEMEGAAVAAVAMMLAEYAAKARSGSNHRDGKNVSKWVLKGRMNTINRWPV
jgi:hypothetical protein